MGVSVKDNDKGLTAMNIEPTNTNMTKMYIGMYKTIRVVNDIIEGMKTSAISSEAEKNRIAGEAYLMRGMTYFNLVRLFGRVSLVIMPPTSYGDAQTPRAEVADVYKQIISDLTDAYSKLPLPADKVVGRPHKYAAQALLAKVYLTLAGNEEESEYWQKPMMRHWMFISMADTNWLRSTRCMAAPIRIIRNLSLKFSFRVLSMTGV